MIPGKGERKEGELVRDLRSGYGETQQSAGQHTVFILLPAFGSVEPPSFPSPVLLALPQDLSSSYCLPSHTSLTLSPAPALPLQS